MSITVPRVFISSTSEFANERELLRREIESLPGFRLHAYTYETDAAGLASPETRLRGILENSEIVLLILGDSFGTEYPGTATSIVEWEYEYAKSNRKELKGYVKDPLGPNADPRQTAFVSRAVAFRGGSWIRKFGESRQLVLTAISDLKQWIIDAGTAWVNGQPQRNQWKDRVVLATSAAIALLTVAGTITGVFFNLPIARLAVIFLSGLTMLGALLLLLRANVF